MMAGVVSCVFALRCVALTPTDHATWRGAGPCATLAATAALGDHPDVENAERSLGGKARAPGARELGAPQ